MRAAMSELFTDELVLRVLDLFHAEWAEQMELGANLAVTPMDDAIAKAVRAACLELTKTEREERLERIAEVYPEAAMEARRAMRESSPPRADT
jgi:hypothetical protein